MLGITRRAAALGAAADGHPARLFKGGEPGFCLPSVAEAFRFGALWQDSAGSTPGAVGLTVGRVGFIAGRSSIASQTTATKRPLLTTDSKSIPLLRFDGLDDCLVTPSIDFSACEAVTVIAGVRHFSSANTGTLVSQGAVTTVGRFAVHLPLLSNSGGQNWGVAATTSSSSSVGYAYYLGPTYSVIAQQIVKAPVLRSEKFSPAMVNAAPPVTLAAFGGPDESIGTAGFIADYLLIGERVTEPTLAGNFDLYSLTVIGRRISNAEMLNTSRWINQQMGVVY